MSPRDAGDGRRGQGRSAAAEGAESAAARDARRLPKPLRLARNHARLFGSTALGVLTFAGYTLASPLSARSTRLLIAWDAGVVIYLVLAFAMMSRFEMSLVRRRAAMHDEGAMALLVLTVAAAVASLGAIVAQLGSVGNDQYRGWYFAFAVATILLSWTFIHVIFALHYAHAYYGEGGKGGGLEFPKDDRPDYWDFMYFAFVIGMTFQVSDVQVTSKILRRLVVAHGTVAFLFNVAILALVVNIAGGIIDVPAS